MATWTKKNKSEDNPTWTDETKNTPTWTNKAKSWTPAKFGKAKFGTSKFSRIIAAWTNLTKH